ncbi:MAG: PHP domain-containing protein, partial [Candidatus Brocadiae bacterium]|nr:PHP domain-containing protein [Candidatus Brocadiia bacterium]
AELPAMAARAGLSGLALTDHDSVEGVAAARLAAEAVGIELVPGVELTSYARLPGRSEQTELHIAGLFVDCESPDLTDKLRQLRSVRVERVKEITRRLREMGIEIESEQVLQRGPDAAVGRVHVAQEMIERGYCRDVAEVFGRYIGEGCPAYVPKEKMTPAEAIELVRSARGCAVLCHPDLTSAIEEYIEELVRDGLEALEVYYPRHTPRDKERLLATARRFDLAVTGGSDFHGAAKPNINIGQESVSFVELHELRRRAGLLV